MRLDLAALTPTLVFSLFIHTDNKVFAPFIGGVPPFGALFGDFGISSENGVPYWPPREPKSAEKTVHHPSGVISEVPPMAGLFDYTAD